ncbi:NADP-dependent oxidoreductase domain-containing protein [Calycina marina]|uniref:NADP-dependent oxidoreductase domain-containing protein n=1 Tax=Calycina marina TaxID=1763456 RepID=A0A9P7YW47_9HELO|nr:NADP-dependent oxidoreductase domain-containing protein [Calycina marina]
MCVRGKVFAEWDYFDTWREMQKIPKSKVRNIGVSNFGTQHLKRLLADPSCKVVPAVNQIELHPNNPSPKFVAYNTSKGIHSTGYSCLGSTDSPLYKDPTLLALAKEKGNSPQQCRLAWGIQKGWSVIPKPFNADRIQVNHQLNAWELTDEEMTKLNGMKDRFKVCDDAWIPITVFADDE